MLEKLKNFLKKIINRRAVLMLSVAILLMMAFPVISYADGYSSWITYTDESEWSAKQQLAGEEKTSFAIHTSDLGDALSTFFMWVGEGIHTIYEIPDDEFDLSIDGMLRNDTVQFSLKDGNYFGTAGAKVYTVLRGSVYALFLVYAAWLLLKHAFKNSSKGMIELKEGIVGLVLSFLMIYLFPQFVEIALSFRSIWTYHVMTSFSDSLNTASISASILASYDATQKNFMYALIYMGYQVAPIFYIAGYVIIALTQAVLFGLFPVITILGMKNKKLMTDYFGTFFSNLFVPFIDSVLFLVPVMIGRNIEVPTISYEEVVHEVVDANLDVVQTYKWAVAQPSAQDLNTIANNMVIYIIMLVCIFSIQPARNGILRLLGNAVGIGGMGGGMGALGQLANAAMRGIQMRKRMGDHANGDRSGGNELSSSDMARFEQAHADMINADSSGNKLIDIGNAPGLDRTGDDFVRDGSDGGSVSDSDTRAIISDVADENNRNLDVSASVDDLSGNGVAELDGRVDSISDAVEDLEAGISPTDIDGNVQSIDEHLDADADIEPINSPIDGEVSSVSDISGTPLDSSPIAEVDSTSSDDGKTYETPIDERHANLMDMDSYREAQEKAQDKIAQADAAVASAQADLPALQANVEAKKADFEAISTGTDGRIVTNVDKQVDANKAKIADLQSENISLHQQEQAARNTYMSSPEGSSAKVEANRSAVAASLKLGENQRMIDSLHAENKTLTSSSEYTQATSRITQSRQAYESAKADLTAKQQEIADAKKNGVQAKNELNTANQRFQNAQQKENNYASASARTGGKETTYSSAKQYTDAMKATDVMMGKTDAKGNSIRASEQRTKSIVNYKNFDKAPVASQLNLTAQEKADFYKQRASAEKGRKVGHWIGETAVKGVSTMAGVAGAAVGATAGMYGGAGAATSLGILTGMYSSSVAQNVMGEHFEGAIPSVSEMTARVGESRGAAKYNPYSGTASRFTDTSTPSSPSGPAKGGKAPKSGPKGRDPFGSGGGTNPPNNPPNRGAATRRPPNDPPNTDIFEIERLETERIMEGIKAANGVTDSLKKK